MPKNPITTADIRKTMHSAVDAVLDGSKRAVEQAKKPNTTVDYDGSARYRLTGKYAFDKDRTLGVVGNVLLEPSEIADAVVDGETAHEYDYDSAWNSLGDGNVEIELTVAIKVREIVEAG